MSGRVCSWLYFRAACQLLAVAVILFDWRVVARGLQFFPAVLPFAEKYLAVDREGNQPVFDGVYLPVGPCGCFWEIDFSTVFADLVTTCFSAVAGGGVHLPV